MSTGNPRVAVVLHLIEHQPFGLLFQEDFEAFFAGSERRARLEFADSHGSSAEQLQHLERFLRERVDALVVAVIDPVAVKPILRLYRDAGIPVVAVDNELDAPTSTGPSFWPTTGSSGASWASSSSRRAGAARRSSSSVGSPRAPAPCCGRRGSARPSAGKRR